MDMNNYKYRFDYLRLSTEEKPEPNVDGSTCYEVDTSELYIAYKGQWYKQGSNEDDQAESTLNNNVSINKTNDLKEILNPIEKIEEPFYSDTDSIHTISEQEIDNFEDFEEAEEIDELEEGEE